MARGNSAEEHYSSRLRFCTDKRMDSTFWCPQYHHVRQGCAVHVSDLASLVQYTQDQVRGDNSLSPTEQWACIEHFNRQLKNALKACACGVDWAEHLPWVMLGIGAAPKEDSVVSAAEMVFGSPLTLPGQILTEEDVPADSTRERAGLAVKQFVAASRSYVEVASGIPGTLAEAEMVYVRVERSARRSRRATAALTGYWSAGPWFSTFRWETKRR